MDNFVSKKYSLGLDFGTLSCRSVLVDIRSGELIASEEYVYPHGVFSETFLDGSKLPPLYALAHPKDYLDALYTIIPATLKKGGVSDAELCGIGIDVTSPTVIPLNKNREPLCFDERFQNEPNAYIRLWKHHGNTGYWASKLDAAEADSEWKKYYGGKVNCEFVIPKALEMQNTAPEVWENCAIFCEVGDWLCMELTGTTQASRMMVESNAPCFHGSYPDESVFRQIAPTERPVTEKLLLPTVRTGTAAGTVCKKAAEKLSIGAGIPVAQAIIDSHASVVGCGAVSEGDMVGVFGTSACFLTNSRAELPVDGACCVAWEGHVPELYGYESGQTSFGDILNWIVSNFSNEAVLLKANGENLHSYLQKACADYLPGGSGLTVLDWWNGVRSPMKNPDLTGVIVGLTLNTSPVDIYHAAMEALCFGARRIVDSYLRAGLTVERFIAAGGIAKKSPVLMQMFADVCGFSICICDSDQTGALGSAIYGAAAYAGRERFAELNASMAAKITKQYLPSAERHAEYDRLYKRYLKLSGIFENEFFA